MVQANCLVVLDHAQDAVAAGDLVTVWWLDRFI
jgi:molybdopterin biosynthesis enzyme